MFYFLRGAIAAVCNSYDDDSAAAGAVGFVSDIFERCRVGRDARTITRGSTTAELIPRVRGP